MKKRDSSCAQMAKAKVDIVKKLTGHSIGVRSKYVNYNDEDLLQVVDLLTIKQGTIRD